MSLNLNDLTILRYAHIYRERVSGGMEQYLHQLNSGLLARANVTILQTHLVPRCQPTRVEIQQVGSGRLVWLPIYHHKQDWSRRSLLNGLMAPLQYSRIEFGAKDARKYGRGSVRILLEHLQHRDVIWSDAVIEMLETHNVSALFLHWLSYDVAQVIAAAQRRRIPYGIINHFDNRRLDAPRLRGWLRGASRIGGVSTRDVPSCLRHAFVNLSDAVDVDYFAPARAARLDRPGKFLILLPARVTEGKGHRDLLAAVRTLNQECPGIVVAFAGSVEAGAEPLVAQLESESAAASEPIQLLWLGQLGASELRDWYAVSDVVVLPSFQEGLGRVLLEAQAMARPVIGYNTGGIPEALIDGTTGLLVPLGDSVRLAAAIKSLLQSPIKRLSMGAEGRRFVSEHFSISALISRHEQFCGDVMQARTQPAPCSTA